MRASTAVLIVGIFAISASSVRSFPSEAGKIKNYLQKRCICNLEFKPVCGADDRDYRNICTASCKKVVSTYSQLWFRLEFLANWNSRVLFSNLETCSHWKEIRDLRWLRARFSLTPFGATVKPFVKKSASWSRGNECPRAIITKMEYIKCWGLVIV